MKRTRTACGVRLAILGCLVLFGTVRTADAQVHIEDLRVGFGPATSGNEGNYKIGSWAPARVKIRAEKEAFSGVLELSTSDSDDIEAVFDRRVSVAANETIDVHTFVKAGKDLPQFHLRLVDSSGKIRERTTFESSAGQVAGGAAQSTTLIVSVGRPAGLDVEQIGKRPGYPRDQFRAAHVENVRDLPSRWFGYEAVDFLVLCTDNPQVVEDMDLAARSALESWVRHGGHLVVSVGTSWERVTSVLGQMLPADIHGTETVRQLSDLESYLGQNSPPIRLKDPLSVPRFTNLRGQVLVGSKDLPLAVKGAYGFGTVTLVALEVSREPFVSWDGRTDFWLKLLGIRKQAVQPDAASQGAWAQRALSDLSSHLRLELEQFEGVSLVPFQWVAFFIFLYILLIGPVDYWIVKKVLKRMEFTWITFPSIVVVVSLGAYFTAYLLKGDSLRINKVDVVDVDQATGTLRGTSWFTLFSPQIKNYTVKVVPDLVSGPEPPSQQGGPPIALSWLGLAEDAIGGMGRTSGVSLFRRGYRFGPDAQTLEDVPVQVWSMKGFTARWHGQATAVVDAKLQGIGTDRLKGSVTNRLETPLEECVLAFGRKVYPLGNLPPNGSVVVESRTTEDLRGHMTRRAGSFAVTQAAASSYYNNPTRQFNPNDLLFTMMFHERLPEGNQYATNHYFSDMDLSELLDQQRAILVARVSADGSKLFLNNQEVDTNLNRVCFLRVVLPVTSTSPEPVKAFGMER